MFCRLAMKNVFKSLKDYTIYFMTLTFGVCLFYAFNSIESQTALLKIGESGNEIIKSMLKMMDIISIFISLVLGFLMIYASNFLIKKRKKEFGIYMTLGMKKGKISWILIEETFIVGVVSLAVGLIMGTFLSQILSIIAVSMFEIELTEFKFIFSGGAMLKTIKYFCIIYFVVFMFNIVTVFRYKLIDLINASKKNEKLKIKNMMVAVVLFGISVIFLTVSYYFFMQDGMFNIGVKSLIAILLGCVGTFLFFLSLSGFLIQIVKRIKQVYYNKLNMFLLKQVNANITTTFVSMSIICIMLVIAICVLSTGVGAADLFNKNIKELTPCDMTITSFENGEEAKKDIEKYWYIIKETDKNIEENIKRSAYCTEYTFDNTDCSELYECISVSKKRDLIYLQHIKRNKLTFIALSEYNKNMKLQGKDEITLDKDQVMISYNDDSINEGIDTFLAENRKLTINGKKYNCIKEKTNTNIYISTVYVANMGKVIVPDSVIENAEIKKVYFNIDFKGNKKETQIFGEKIVDIMNSDSMSKKIIDEETSSIYLTKVQVYDENKTRAVMVSYIAIYIGFVFVIASAAVLALQQLSVNSDNTQRYKLLRKIGVEEKEISKVIFKQVAIAFVLPLLLAMVHSVVGIKVANSVLALRGYEDAIAGVTVSAIFIVIIYGGYMLVTYLGCKMIAKENR